MKYKLSDDSFKKLIEIMSILRGKDGCPWDHKQTHQTLIKYLREESFEVIESILKQDDEHLCEELGDLLLQVIFHAQIAHERKAFNIDHIIDRLNKKLIDRHPHVFKTDHVLKKSVEDQWEELKKNEKKDDSPQIKTDFDEIKHLDDPFLKAERIQLIASKQKFDWENPSQVIDKIIEECQEFKEELKTNNRAKLKNELSDILFAVSNLARFTQFDIYELMEQANQKFLSRYQKMLDLAQIKHSGIPFKKLSIDEKENLWQEIKLNNH